MQARRRVWYLLIGTGVVITAALTVLFVSSAPSTSSMNSDIQRVAFESGDTPVVVDVDVLDTSDKRKRGLSGKEQLPEGTGALFMYEKSQRIGIWMREMQFPIDIIWMNQSGRVVSIKENAAPESYPEVFRPPEPARYVLEVNAGFVDQYNIQAGDVARFIHKTSQ